MTETESFVPYLINTTNSTLKSAGNMPTQCCSTVSTCDSSATAISVYSFAASLTNSILNTGYGVHTTIPPLFKLNKNYNLVDALPYVDPLNVEVEGEVKTLINEEMNNILNENGGEMKNYLSTFPVPDTPIIDNPQTAIGKEFLRCSYGKSMDKLDMSVYSSLDAPSQNALNDINAWDKSVQNAHCLLEHSYTAIMNLELMLNFAKDAWLKHLARLELQEKTASDRLLRSRHECEDVNKRRKLEQMSCGNTLRSLQREKEDAMQKNGKILSALGELEAEIMELRKKCIKKGVLPEKYCKRKRSGENGTEDGDISDSD